MVTNFRNEIPEKEYHLAIPSHQPRNVTTPKKQGTFTKKEMRENLGIIRSEGEYIWPKSSE